MKSRIVILSMLVFGMLLSTAGAGLAVSGGQNDASVAQYGQSKNDAPAGGGNVLGDEDSGTNAAPNDDTPGGGGAVQPSRQVEAGANTGSSLPFTGFAAVPILVGGIALLSAGLVLRRRTGAER